MSESNQCGVESSVLGRDTSETEALEVIADVAKSLQLAKTFFSSRPDCNRNYTLRAGEPYFIHLACINPELNSLSIVSSIPLLHDTFQAKDDMNTVKRRAAVVMDTLNPAQEISHNVWFWISEQATACESQIGALKLRSGFLSFPDNILSDVLEFASYQQNKDEQIAIKSTVNAATKLSHVCSRFRTLALSTFNLWNCIAPSMRTEAISSCVARCGPEGGNIIILASSFQ